MLKKFLKNYHFKAAEKILDNIDSILDNNVKFIEQDHSKASCEKN